MSKPILALLLVGAALLGETEFAQAQGAATAYPWCAMYMGGRSSGGFRSCYFETWGQCMETLSGIGGLCVASPYYHGQAAPLPHHPEVIPHRHRHF